MLQSFQMVSSKFAMNFLIKLKFLTKSSDQDVWKLFMNYFLKSINTVIKLQRSEDQILKWALKTIESTLKLLHSFSKNIRKKQLK